MKDEDIQKRLNALPIPEPRPEARQRAIREATDEFNRQFKIGQKRTKGFGRWWRLLGKTLTGGSTMVKPIAVTTSLVLALGILVVI